MAVPQAKTVSGGGVDLTVREAGSGFPVVFIHGFPELAFSWRHQQPALAAAGLRAIIYDQRGYGTSDKPDEVDAYSLERLVGDLIGILDALELDRAVVVGHDWGSIVAWSAAVMHPGRVERIVSLNVPYRGWCAGFPPIDFIRERLADRFDYVLRFQELGRPEAAFSRDPESWLRRIYQGIAFRPDFQSEEEFAVYREAFRRGGISGPVNFYRNIDANWQATAHLADSIISQPTMAIAVDSDPVLPAELMEGMERWVPQLRVELITDCGHWTQQEQPGAVNALLLDFLGDLAS